MMKWSSSLCATGLLMICLSLGCARKVDRTEFSGPYLGQDPPGLQAEVFAPGIVSTDAEEVMYGFFNDGSLLFFERIGRDFDGDWIDAPLFRMEMNDGVWNEPMLRAEAGRPWYFEYADALEGFVVWFAWRKNLDGSGPTLDIDLWRVVKESEGWSEPERFGPPVNTDDFDSWPSLSESGTLYFFSTREGGLGRSDLHRAVPRDAGDFDVENLGSVINSEHSDHDPFVAPDESYLLFCSNRPGVLGENDIYVSFRAQDGTWTTPRNLGADVNTPGDDTRPYVTSDGKYLFFNSTDRGSRDIYWVSAEVIAQLKPSDHAEAH